jgi:hypothetical protein
MLDELLVVLDVLLLAVVDVLLFEKDGCKDDSDFDCEMFELFVVVVVVLVLVVVVIQGLSLATQHIFMLKIFYCAALCVSHLTILLTV